VPGKRELNAAQIIHNDLLKSGFEWSLFETPEGWRFGRAVWIQDIEGFGKRDYGKPAIDAKRGMLPPKLARMMVNLAAAPKGGVIYDPFVGSGSILLESLLLGYRAAGSDISAAAVADTKANLKWLKKEYPETSKREAGAFVADASRPLPVAAPDAIVTEGYLGHPVRQTTSYAEILAEERTVGLLLEKFLAQAANISPTGSRLVITLPIWKLETGRRRLELVDRIGSLGYTVVRPIPEQLKFSGVTDRQTIEVSRPGQRVIHELLILERT
jgi:tRNA G10  N-methylase Trm11